MEKSGENKGKYTRRLHGKSYQTSVGNRQWREDEAIIQSRTPRRRKQVSFEDAKMVIGIGAWYRNEKESLIMPIDEIESYYAPIP